MKKYIFLLFAFFGILSNVYSQGRGVKIGFIDMEYILQNVPDYTEAKNQLEQKALRWKQEIELKSLEITKLEESLKTERVLLTKELIEEREEEIAFQKKEFLDYQDKRFGPRGDLVIQKTVLVQPIQDQVFTAAQDIAEAKKYDFIFDKTSDLTMLFAAKRFDISDQVIRVITRSAKRDQLTKKQLKAEEERDAKLDLEDDLKTNPDYLARQKKLDDKKAAREKLIADRKAATEAKLAEREEARRKILEDRENKKNGTIPANTTNEGDNKSSDEGNKSDTNSEDKEAQAKAFEDAKQAKADERARVLEERKRNLEEKRAKAIADREAARLEKEERLRKLKENNNKP